MSSDTKTCPRCGQTFPATTEFFHRDKDHLSSKCKQCARAAAKAWTQSNIDRKRQNDKRYYQENSDRVKERMREYRNAHPEQMSERDRAYYQRNRDRIRARVKQYRDAHPELIRERKRLYALQHRDYLRQYRRNRYLQNPQQKRDYQRANAHRWRISRNAINRNYRARKRAAAGRHTAADVRAQYAAQNGLCFWCKCAVGDKFHVDHYIPLARGGSNSADNIVIACPLCNTRRGDKLPSEWQP